MPWRSASASLPVARSNFERASISEAIASGEEQSMRIFPSVSKAIKRKVASTSGFTTVMLSS